ncbi:hypothetical protein LZ30DRAFT_693647 [Colletotrichum cereale]|nr:hypothetical protein LZ30DRAFT_693647 [Colletotrichum cereale]
MYPHDLRLSPSSGILGPFPTLTEQEAEDMMLLAAAANLRSPSTGLGFNTFGITLPSHRSTQLSCSTSLDTSVSSTTQNMDTAEEVDWTRRGAADLSPTDSFSWDQAPETEDSTMLFLDDDLYLASNYTGDEECPRRYRLSDLMLDAEYVVQDWSYL